MSSRLAALLLVPYSLLLTPYGFYDTLLLTLHGFYDTLLLTLHGLYDTLLLTLHGLYDTLHLTPYGLYAPCSLRHALYGATDHIVKSVDLTLIISFLLTF